ncbi:4Fe-4S binding protein [Patescibacteria group bacterium]|nr:4Fe-4S binding protein [Patescibacteria group bacterium]
MKVIIDTKKCIFCGACEELTLKAIISPGDKPASLNPKANLNDPVTKENIKMAAETCPQRAIKIKP